MNETMGIELELKTKGFSDKMKEIQQKAGAFAEKAKEQMKLGLTFDTDKANQDIENYKNKLNSVNANLERLKNAQATKTSFFKDQSEQVEYLKTKIEQLQNKIDKTNATPFSKIGSALRNLKSPGEVAKNMFGMIKSILQDAAQKATSFVGGLFKIGTGFIKGKKEGNQFSSSLKKGLSNLSSTLKKFGLSLLGIRTAMAAVKRAASAYLSFDTELNDSFTNSWNTLGSLLAPALELVANLFAYAASAVASFVKALTGVDLVARANSKALASQSKSAKDAQKSLSSWHDITNINDNDSNSGSDVPQISTVNTGNLLDGILNDIENGNWYNIGKRVADRLNSVFESIDWVKTGKKIGTGINHALDIGLGFVENFHWRTLGENVGKGFDTAFKTVEWNKLADLLSGYWTGIYDMISGFLENVDWQNIGRTIVQFIGRIDWSGIASSLFEMLGAALGAMAGMLWGLISEVCKNIGNYFSEKIKEQGGNVGAGITQGILEGIADIGSWIVDHIFKPFINGFKKAFGIHSPSTVMVTMGGYIVDGLKNGIGNVWEKVNSKFTSFKNSLSNFFNTNNFKNIGSNIVSGISSGINSMKSTLQANVSSLANDITGRLKNLLGIHSPSKVMKEQIGKFIPQGIAEGIDTDEMAISSSLESVIENMKNNLKEVPQLAELEYSHAPNLISNNTFTSNSNNSEQIELLREQNRLLIQLVNKNSNIELDGKNLSKGLYPYFKEEERRRNPSKVVIR